MTRTVFEKAIEADGLVKDYGEVRALDGLDLDVEAGTVFGLLGPNGAGKSTTVRILTTLSRATAGSARVAGFDVAREPLQVRRAIGVVGQKHGCDLEATGRENLVLQGELYGMAARAPRADELLDRFELPEPPTARPRRTPAACSGGSTSRSASSTARRCCSSTSRRPGWTRRRGR